MKVFFDHVKLAQKGSWTGIPYKPIIKSHEIALPLLKGAKHQAETILSVLESLQSLTWNKPLRELVLQQQYKDAFLSSSPGPSHPFVVVLWVHSQYGDPGADVDQQHGKGVFQGAGLLHAALCVWGVLEVVALWVSIEAHPVDVQQATNQAVQLIELQQLQVGHLQCKGKGVQILRGCYISSTLRGRL